MKKIMYRFVSLMCFTFCDSKTLELIKKKAQNWLWKSKTQCVNVSIKYQIVNLHLNGKFDLYRQEPKHWRNIIHCSLLHCDILCLVNSSQQLVQSAECIVLVHFILCVHPNMKINQNKSKIQGQNWWSNQFNEFVKLHFRLLLQEIFSLLLFKSLASNLHSATVSRRF